MPKDVDEALAAVKGEFKKLDGEIKKAWKDRKSVPVSVEKSLDGLKVRIEELEKRVKAKL